MSTPVEEIKERLNIIEVIQEYVPLKNAGANHKGRCPLHNEKTPSFTVSESKQFFHCFGCGKGGDVFTFIQEIEKVEFAEALRMLAKKANVELRPTNPREHNARTRLLDALTLAAQFYHAALQQSKEGERARAYIKKRGVSAETVEAFQLGYSAESWDAVIQFLKKRGYTDKEVEQAGLSIFSAKTKAWYDRFRGRLMFPIHNMYGNVIGFTARTLDPEQKEAKYINSPQTAVYNKSAALYGLHLAKKHIQSVDATVLVEGNMDVVTAHQANIRNVVAASGTALTSDQIRILKRYSSNVILSFDGDAAGLSAAWRGMQLAIHEGMNIKVLVLPPGQDPDDIIRINPQDFVTRARAAKPFMEYAFSTVLKPLDLASVQHKKRAAKELLPMIDLFPDKIEQTHYIQLLAKQLNVAPAILEEAMKAQRRSNARVRNRVDGGHEFAQQRNALQTNTVRMNGTPNAHTKDRLELLSERLLALVISHPPEFALVHQHVRPEHLSGAHFPALYKSFESFYNQSGIFNPDQVPVGDPELASAVRTLSLIGEELYGSMTPNEVQEERDTLLEGVERLRIQRRLTQVEQALAQAEMSNDAAIIEKLSAEFRLLTDSLKQLG